VTVTVGASYRETNTYNTPEESPDTKSNFVSAQDTHESHEKTEPTIEVPLIKLCYGRSGDKGDVANIGLIARRPEFYPIIRTHITEKVLLLSCLSAQTHEQLFLKVVAQHFKHFLKGVVKRYEVPGINGLNFVMTQSLGGGGLASLNIDRQGKTYAQILLSYPVSVPLRLLQHQDVVGDYNGPVAARL